MSLLFFPKRNDFVVVSEFKGLFPKVKEGALGLEEPNTDVDVEGGLDFSVEGAGVFLTGVERMGGAGS